MKLDQEAKLAESLLKGKIVNKVWRHRENEVGIEFSDGTTLFVDQNENGLELSITDGQDNKMDE
jgi:hypothetical protein